MDTELRHTRVAEVCDLVDAGSLRRRIRAALPAEALRPRPVRVLWFVPHVVLAAIGTYLLIEHRPVWWAASIVSIAIGGSYGAMCLLAHEVMHGAVVRSRRVQNLVGMLGFAPFLISPTLWRVWHNTVHHGHTNDHERDPDVFGTVERYRRDAVTRRLVTIVPGSRAWWSPLFFFYWFALHGQFVLWSLSRTVPGFSGLRRGRAVADSASFACCWAMLAYRAGPLGAVLSVAVPLAIGNAVVMAYVATNHLLRHRGYGGHPLRTAMSVRTSPWLDRLHFRFSHHVEHHLFPAMSGRDLPLVRRWLEVNHPEDYVAPPHGRALAALFATPRLYLDDDTLSDPGAGSSHDVDVAALARRLSGVAGPAGASGARR